MPLIPADPEVLLMHTWHTLPDPCKRWWTRRYELFSRYDEGIMMSEELWFQVTSELVAKYTAKLLQQLVPDATTVVDYFCGGGGNTIHLAKVFPRVVAVDINENNLVCTANNTEVYGVRERVELVHQDFCEYHGGLHADIVFASPPWGGQAYSRDYFDLRLLQPEPLDRALATARTIAPNIAMFLPRSIDVDQLREITQEVFGAGSVARCINVSERGYAKACLVLWGPALTAHV